MSFFTDILRYVKRVLTSKTAAATVALVVSLYYFSKRAGKVIPSTKLSQFLLLLSQNQIAEVFVSGNIIRYKPTSTESWYWTNAAMLTKDRIYKLLKNKPNIAISCQEDQVEKITPLTLLLFGGTFFLGLKLYDLYVEQLNSNKSLRENLYTDNTFDDIYGHEDAKRELKEVIDFLKDPQKYKAIGARLRRGILLFGPSGTGKTLLARATAGESKAAFLSCSGSEFMELYVGVGPKRARSVQPCIIFIDEIDGIGTKRRSQFSGPDQGAGDQERSSTLNQLLTEMDGFREKANIVVIAATNRYSLLDEALVRSGRFDTKLKIDLPNEKERFGIMKIHLRNKKHSISEENLQKIANAANNFSGADLENIVNESAYICIQQKHSVISDKDLEESFEKLASQRKAA